jgi:hypothetical protein
VFLSNNQLVDADQKVTDNLTLSIFTSDLVPKDSGIRTIGYVNVSGKIHGATSVTSRNTMNFAIAQLKKDIIASISNRYELLCEELIRKSTDTLEKKVLSQSEKLHLPYRYFSSSELTYCDYAFAEESAQDVKQRFSALLGINSSQIISKEKLIVKQPKSTATSICSDNNNETNAFLRILLSLWALILSLFGTSKQKTE